MAQRQAGLSGRQPRCSARVAPASRAADAELLRAARTTSCARRCTRSMRLTPTIVEVVVRAPLAARALPARASSTACRTTRRSRRGADGTRARDGRPGADRRLGRPRAGLVSTIVLEMGGSSDLCALLEPGEPVVLMGPTGTPTEIAAGRDRGAGRRRPGQRGAVLDRPGVARRRLAGALFRRLQEDASTATRSRRSRRAADVVVWCCDEAPGFTPDRAAGPRVRRQHRARRCAPTRAGALGEQPIALARRRPHHRHRLRRHDGGGRRARGTACWRRTSSPAIAAIGSINSPMQCMMKEICAQCLQPHAIR